MAKPTARKPDKGNPDAGDLLPARLTDIAGALAKAIEEPVRAEFGLPPKDWKVMQVLAVHGPLPPNEIHRVGGQNKSQISRALKCLFDRELVARCPHPEDDRTFVVSLTDAGQEMYSTALRKMRRRQTDFLKTLPDDEAEDLASVLVRLRAALAK